MSAAALLSASADAPSAPTADPLPVSPTTAPATSVVSDISAQIAAKPWIEGIADPALKQYATTKGWKEPTDLLQQYFHMEKLLGADRVPLPKGVDDKEGWDRFYKAAGRPETPDGYKLPAPAAGDKGFAADAAKVFHESGLSTNQAQKLAQWYAGYGAKIQEAQAAAIQARNTQELEVFRQEQGQLFDAKLELGRRAAKQFGFTNEELVAIENQFGTKTLLTRFAAIGEAMSEHVVTGEGEKAFSGMSATAALAQINELKADKEFVAKYTAGDRDAKLRMETLVAAAAGMTLDDYRASLGTPSTR